jgi:hypothetical protein
MNQTSTITSTTTKKILLAVGSESAINKIRMDNASRFQSFTTDTIKKTVYLYAVKF